MNEKKKRLIVAALLFMQALVILVVGAYLAWHEYETTTDPHNRWLFCDCCYGECDCNTPPALVGISMAAFIVPITFVLAVFSIFMAVSYYACGRFDCPDVFLEKREEYVEVEVWGE